MKSMKVKITDPAPERGIGRPEWEPTVEQRKTVEAMAGYGIPHDDIATVLGVDPKTLRKHCASELDQGAIKANAKIAERLWKRATEGEDSAGITALIWWTKARMGWKETSAHEHSGPGGVPLVPQLHYVNAPGMVDGDDSGAVDGQ